MTLRFLTTTALLFTAVAGVAALASSGTSQSLPGRKTPAAAKRYHFLLCRQDQRYGLGDWDWRYGSRTVRVLTHAPHPDFLLIQRDQSLFVITDDAAVQSALAALAPVEELGRRQGELGRQQGVLGRRQGELGAQQAQSSSPTQQTEVGHRQGELGRLQTELGQRQGELGRQEADAMAKATEQLIPVFNTAFAQGKARPVADGS